ncbi:MAG: sigma-70 family RNA polymerase sigma factor [Kurthia sp.]|nr:sigma-70 family RNA polymerase sigma factor [Candidatus Kurthia equi]
MEFEAMLQQLEPMISAHLRKLHIYKDHAHFRQVARGAIWQAWLKYDSQRGDFPPFASQTIRGALLDELKSTHRYEAHVHPTESTVLQELREQDYTPTKKDVLTILQEYTSQTELELLSAYYYEGYSTAEIAKIVKMTVPALQKSRSRLLQRLRKQLKKSDFY